MLLILYLQAAAAVASAVKQPAMTPESQVRKLRNNCKAWKVLEDRFVLQLFAPTVSIYAYLNQPVASLLMDWHEGGINLLI